MEITRKNFSEQYDNITNDLKRSCFVAFDAEFTAILTGDKFKHRIFDTCEQRYNEMKDEISNMIMSQIGLTIFCYERDLDRYVATAYTFHLSPQVIGDIDQKFIFQASTLQFLCRYNFNFNKFIYEGLPYLSESEERSIRQQLREKTLCTNILTALPIEDEKLLQNYCSEISKWLINSTEDTMYIDIDTPLLRYILHNEIRNRFPDVLTTDSLGNSHKVLIYRNKDIEGAINAASEILEENVINHLLGFSHIIKLLTTYQKPIIGHNIFLDTIFFHNQFIGPLPAKYTDFKRNINEMFPALFDTKFISYEMRRKLSFDECWKSNALQDLYEFFSEDKCKRIGKGVNLIKLSTPFDVKQSYHEAGWDSFCTGYCFIRLGHWAACENSGKYRPVSPKEKLAALSQYANKVNVIRGAVPYMNFAGSDPPSNRLKLLHVKTLKERTINVSQVASLLAGFGSIDVKPYGSKSALVAANSQQTVDKILKQFRNSREYSISMYSVYRHAPASRMIMWSGALITGSFMLLLLHKKINT